MQLVNRKKILSIAYLMLMVNYTAVYAQKAPVLLQHGAHRAGKRMDSAMIKWRGYGLGQFIHYGLYSMLGGKWKGKQYNGASEWIRSWAAVEKTEYDALNKQFNPTNFHPDQWAAMAKQMGVRYTTITTKHHDGFCLWPSQYTDYTVASSPYKKDMIGPLVNAYDKAGIDVYLYFSIIDWHHPDWRTDIKTTADSAAFERFKIFTKNQLTELVKNYPSIKGLWFDGTWDNSWKKNGAFSDSLEQYLKQLNPQLIIGSRLRADEKGARHFDSNGLLMGDYEQGWERKIPATYADTHGNDWDCVMTIPENGWGYAEQWMGHWKSSAELIEMLAKCVSLDGNLVINFTPKGDGTFRPEETKTAAQIGQWMQTNAAAIYNSGYSQWEKQDWGYFTQPYNDSSKLYMIVFNAPLSGKFKVLPKGKKTIHSAALLKSKSTQLPLERIDFGGVFITVPSLEKYKEPFVIELTISDSKTEGKEQKAKT